MPSRGVIDLEEDLLDPVYSQYEPEMLSILIHCSETMFVKYNLCSRMYNVPCICYCDTLGIICMNKKLRYALLIKYPVL